MGLQIARIAPLRKVPPHVSPIKANLLCLLSMLAWAAGLPAAEYLIDAIPPLPLTAMRMVLAALLLLPLWWWQEGAGTIRRAPWVRGILIGWLMLGMAGILLVVAQAHSDPVTVAIVSATMPVMGIALECVTTGRRVTLFLIFGLILSIAGGVLAYAESMGGFQFGIGALAAHGLIACYTLGSHLTITALPGMTPLGRCTLTLAGAAIATTLLAAGGAILGAPSVDWPALGLREGVALLVFALFGVTLAQLFWISAIGNLGIGLASLHMNAAPFYVMVFMVALGAPWNWIQAAGAAIVAAGVMVAQIQPAKPSLRMN
jgi:drug/metabolite transporter (DMT)-like permease